MTTLPQFGRYQTISKLADGGMAVVYRAYDPKAKREVALKVIAGNFSSDDRFHRLFEREAEVIASLEHSAIVRLYDFGDQNDQPYLVMRLMPGGSLDDYLQKNGAVSLDKVIEWLSRLAPALDVAHNKDVVHRDLKPGNILFDEEKKPYIADFGIAKVTSQATLGVHQTGSPIGTPSYMSPEQALGEKKEDRRSDIYSLGVILFELLAGQPPYRGTRAELIDQHINEPVPNILEIKPDLPSGCQTVIERAMAKPPSERYASAGEMVEALKAAAEGRALTSASLVERWAHFLVPGAVILVLLFALATLAHQGAGLLAITSATIVIGLLLFACWKLVGGPVGTLKLLNSYNTSEVVAGPWTLRGFPRQQTIRGPQVEAYGVKMIKVSKAKPTNPQAQRAIKVEATDIEGEVFMMATLSPSDGPQPFADGAEISYQ